ncbi:MAG TPA: AAA family ATPase [Verrucomicrobiota bacterium]|nr:AAA family ATPase [Verrucomicrobiota bacterium]
MFDRWYATELKACLERPYVQLLFGARQTGKTTLLNALLPSETLRVDLANPEERSRHLADPGRFVKLCRDLPAAPDGRLVFVDEAQAVPTVFDAVQYLYDNDKRRWRFVLCGSSARKLRKTGANLLPGRCFYHRLHPLTMAEHPPEPKRIEYAVSPVPLEWKAGTLPANPFPTWGLEERLAYGALPGVVAAQEADRARMLTGFTLVHLEEEIRREALVKDWGAFVRFLELAAAESGQVVNFAGIAQETGLSPPTVKSHYQLLEDMFIGFRLPVYSGSKRKNLLSTPKFLFFDPGVRHAAAGLRASLEIVRVNPGAFFEQWVGIELWKRLQYLGEGRLHYLRTRDGMEIDYIIEHRGALTPIEVKWSERPAVQDARHLLSFLREHPKQAQHGYIVCRCSAPLRLHDQITALPWSCL